MRRSPALTAVRHLSSCLLALAGLALFRASELLSKLLAAFSLVTSEGHLFPAPLEVAFLISQSVLIAFCLAPPLRTALRNRWAALATALATSLGLVFAQHHAYQHARAALPIAEPHANQCPWYSASGLGSYVSRAMKIAPEVWTDINNEQCTWLKLAHDTTLGMDTEWEVLKSKAYNPRFIATHYAANSVFAMSAVFGIGARAFTHIPAERGTLLALKDKATILSSSYEATSFVLSQQTATVSSIDPGANPLSALAARISSWEEKMLLGLRPRLTAQP